MEIVPSVTTGIKLAGTSLTTIFVKAQQAFNSFSGENLKKVLSDSSTVLNKEFMEARGSCSGQYAVTNVSEENILKKLMCKIIDNDNKEEASLSEESLNTLSSIINVYSKKRYISMPKSMYESEKNAASEAIRNGIIGTQLVNTGVDIGVAAVKSSTPSNTFVKKYLTPSPPKTESPLVSAVSALGLSVAPAAATLATFYMGKKIFQKFNTAISKKYIPDFNLLVIALTERQKMKIQANRKFTSCQDKIMKQFYKEIEDYFTEYSSSDSVFNFNYNPLENPVMITKKAFDFKKKELKKGNYPAPGLLQGEANIRCKPAHDKEIAVINSDIKNIKGITKEFTTLFTTTSDLDLNELIQATIELVPILSTIESTNTNISELRAVIKSKIDEIKQQQQQQSIGSRASNFLFGRHRGGKTVNRRKEKRRKTIRRR